MACGSGEGGDLLTYSIVTKDADPSIEQLHDRMPLILDGEAVDAWVSGSPEDSMGLAMTAPEPSMDYYEVAKAVGNVRNQGRQLMEPLAA